MWCVLSMKFGLEISSKIGQQPALAVLNRSLYFEISPKQIYAVD